MNAREYGNEVPFDSLDGPFNIVVSVYFEWCEFDGASIRPFG